MKTAKMRNAFGAVAAFLSLTAGTANAEFAQEASLVDEASAATTVSAVDWSAEHEPGTRKTLDVDGVEFAFRYCPGGSLEVGTPEAPKVLDVDDG